MQGTKFFFHFTCPLDEYFPDFGCPNIKATRPKNDSKCFFLVNLSLCRANTDSCSIMPESVLPSANTGKVAGITNTILNFVSLMIFNCGNESLACRRISVALANV